MQLLDSEEISRISLNKPVPLTLHPAKVYLSSLAPNSRGTMLSALNTVASVLTEGRCDATTLDWSKLRYQHTAAIRTSLAQSFAPNTVNKMIVGIRRVLTEAYRLDLISASDYHKAIDLKNVRVLADLNGRALSLSEIKGLISHCLNSDTVLAKRDGAVIGILRGSGIRRQELVDLKLSDLDKDTGEVKIRHGKGNKFRTVYLNDIALLLVERWLDVRGYAQSALICPVNKGGKVILKHFANGDGIYKSIKNRAKLAGVADFSPHDFRRTFASDLLEADEDVFTVQDLMGHVSTATTKKYDLRGEARKKRAVRKLKF